METATVKPKAKTRWMAGFGPAPEDDVPAVRDDLGRVWRQAPQAGPGQYSFADRHFSTLGELHMRTDLTLAV